MNTGGPRLTDEELGLALKHGDITAFSDLFERHSRAIFAYMSRRLLSQAESDDLIQEVCLRVLRAIKSFESGRGSFKTWLFAIARNVAIDALRQRARSTAHPGAHALNGRDSPPDRVLRRFARAIVQSLESRA